MPAEVTFPDGLESAVTDMQGNFHHLSLNLFEYFSAEVQTSRGRGDGASLARVNGLIAGAVFAQLA